MDQTTWKAQVEQTDPWAMPTAEQFSSAFDAFVVAFLFPAFVACLVAWGVRQIVDAVA